ncbi:enoyl-CoA hydratase-related protein [Neobacillus novalis]|uniref:Enoyl-CoA hydratase-related protein n=1 Tax=Neobacillus novalis TaxID=220687 RepID=A0AA95SE51_9BACI|nr:enoyl-CoA hydratase-related protein [Neobacillus novalis]WHY83996.1 enoyl-CoA hydratase-related protein [Neobacillus novalis]
MSYFEVIQQERIVKLILNRPPVNALSLEVLEELRMHLEKVNNHKENRVLIITSCGEKFFAAGADIKGLKNVSVEEGKVINQQFLHTFDQLAKLPIPTICAVNGLALGGGTELALACDIRIASENAQLGLPETNLGLIPGGGGTQRMPRIVSIGRAKDLLFTGRRVSAQEALEIGLVEYVVPYHELSDFSERLAKTISEKSPNAIRTIKQAIMSGMNTDLPTGLEIELELGSHCFGSEDFQKGISAFLEKRKPEF